MNRTKQITTALNTFYEKPIAKTSLELFFTIGLVMFLAFFAIQPTLVTMSDLIKEIEEKQALNENFSKKLAALASAQVEYASIQNQIPVLDQAIPLQVDVTENLKIIEKIATDSQIVIASLAVLEVPEVAATETDFSKLERKSLAIQLNATGDYAALRLFVENLLNNRRVFVTDSIAISINERNNNKTLQATISISIPYYGLPSTEKANESN